MSFRAEAGLPKMGQGGFQFPCLEFGIQACSSRGGGLHPQAQGGEVGPLEPPGHIPVEVAGMQGVGGMETEACAPAGQFFEDGEQMSLSLHQEGVIIERHL